MEIKARNGQYGGQTSYQPSYSYQPPPAYPSGGHSNSNQPLLIIIPTSSSGKGSSYKAQPAYSPPPPAPVATYKSEPASYAPTADHGHSSYSDRASARRRVSSQMRSSLQAHAATPRKFIDKMILEPSHRIRNHIGFPLVSYRPVQYQSSLSEQSASTNNPTSAKPYDFAEPQEIHVSRRRSGRALPRTRHMLDEQRYWVQNKNFNNDVVINHDNKSGHKPYNYNPYLKQNSRFANLSLSEQSLMDSYK